MLQVQILFSDTHTHPCEQPRAFTWISESGGWFCKAAAIVGVMLIGPHYSFHLSPFGSILCCQVCLKCLIGYTSIEVRNNFKRQADFMRHDFPLLGLACSLPA